jgi:hypothetical protein
LNFSPAFPALSLLDLHPYNAPPLVDDSKRGFMAVFAFITQLTFFVMLLPYNIVEKSPIDPKDDFSEIVFIMIASTAMFGLTLSLQHVHAARFNSSMMLLREENANEIQRKERSQQRNRSLSTYIYAQTLNRPKFT